MKLVSNHLKYSSNVWLTSAILTPCILGLITSISDGNLQEMPMLIILAIPIGVIFSIPNYLILLFFVWQINAVKLTINEKKIILTFIAIILTFALFMLIDMEPTLFGCSYSATLTFGIWFFDLYRPASEDFLRKEPLPKIKMLEDILDDEIY